MGEAAINKVLRHCREKTAILLDDESFNVGRAVGKLSNIADFICYDKGIMKIVKVCYQSISQKELNDLLNYNDSQLNATTILQIDFWEKNARKPFYRTKLFYNKPSQIICNGLKELIK